MRRTFALDQILLALFLSFLGVGCRSNLSSDVAQIHAQKSVDLIAWLNPANLPQDLKERDPFFQQMVCKELVARHEINFLLSSFDTLKDSESRSWLVAGVLGNINDHRISHALAVRLSDKEDEESYFIANYLAERGNTNALAILNKHYYQYPVPSWQWSVTVELFGKYRYQPAVSNLIDSLDAASLNVSGAACNALHQIFPDSPRNFIGPTEAEKYFTTRLAENARTPAQAN
jgi:hypothetical protein